MSRPIVATACMFGSSESWGALTAPASMAPRVLECPPPQKRTFDGPACGFAWAPGVHPLGVADKSKEAVRHPWCLCFDSHLTPPAPCMMNSLTRRLPQRGD
jgi:hypothetical protein